jgi:hypothetical protein
MPLRCFAYLFFAIAAALALALVAPKEAFRCLVGGAVDWAAGVAPAFSTAAVVQAADAGKIAVAVASPLTASALASACNLAGTTPVPAAAGGVIAAPPAAGAMAAPAAVLLPG